MKSLHDLLRALVDANADSLQLHPEQPPTLLKDRIGTHLEPSSMGFDRISRLLDQALDVTTRRALEAKKSAEGFFDAGPQGRFSYRARLLAEGPAIAFRRAEAEAGTASIAGGLSFGSGYTVLSLLTSSLKRGASDVVFSGGAAAAMRIGGEMQTIEGAVFTDAEITDALGPSWTTVRRDELAQVGNVDLAFEVPHAGRSMRFRVNIFRQLRGVAAAFRPIWDRIPEAAALHLPSEILAMGDYPHGLVLVAGPTGAGKSTTLSLVIDHLTRTQAKHIITLEDPIEYLYRRGKSLVHQREIGVHVESFAGGLRAALRECPDVILVGEMRDLDTITAALTAAETGHLVLSTLHSSSAAQAVDRIIDVFPQHQQAQIRIQVAEVLRMVVTQRLLPTGDGRSRVPVVEMVRISYAFSNLIREKKTHMFASQIQTSQKDGNLPFDLSLSRLVKDGLVPADVALRTAHDPQYLKTLIGGI